MKSFFLIVILLLIVNLVFSQENDSLIVIQSPTGRLSGLINIQDLGNGETSPGEKKFEGNWAGVEFGINGFANASYNSYANPDDHFMNNDLIRSNLLNLNILQYSRGIQQIRNNIGLVTGLGLCFQSYHFNDNTTIIIDENRKVQPSVLYFDSSQKSKLSVLYLNVPLLFEVQIPINHVNNRLYISTGITGSKRLEAHTKIKYRKDGEKEKVKSPGSYSINSYKVAATFRIGYRRANLFATYDLVPLFEHYKGPVLYPFSAGIRLISF
jgi:hypothetical protein